MLADGRVLRTLHGARLCDALLKAVLERTGWQTETEMVILTARGQRPLMLAVRLALHAHSPEPPSAASQAAKEIHDRPMNGRHFGEVPRE